MQQDRSKAKLGLLRFTDEKKFLSWNPVVPQIQTCSHPFTNDLYLTGFWLVQNIFFNQIAIIFMEHNGFLCLAFSSNGESYLKVIWGLLTRMSYRSLLEISCLLLIFIAQTFLKKASLFLLIICFMFYCWLGETKVFKASFFKFPEMYLACVMMHFQKTLTSWCMLNDPDF